MAETATASGLMEIALKGTAIDMHQNLHQPPKLTQSNHNFDESSPDEQTSCADIPTVSIAHSNYKNNNSSPTNLSTTFRCERCDNFETSSRATLLLHVVQCLSSPARLKTEENDAENLSVGAVSTASSHIDQANSVAANGGIKSKDQSLLNPISAANSGVSPNGTSRKVFECDVCNMKFSNGANMRRHKMRHTGVKPYECRVCQKRFFRKDHLAEHFTTHTKTLPYHCPICNRGFQRQIAMRAHFQNEHVGQHDLVKTCPLCSYRAGSMKSLRIHFYNRHGIDLDNPGPGASSSLLLALESQASQAAAAAGVNFVPNLSVAAVAAAAAASASAANVTNQSDSGESLRSTDNATPPMHFLTPHVEISMPDNSGDLYNGNTVGCTGGEPSSESTRLGKERDTVSPSPPTTAAHRTNVCASPGLLQDQPMDCNSKAIHSNAMSALRMTLSPKSNHYDNHIMPSISLIPIKQEPINEDLSNEQSKNGQKNTNCNENVSTDNESEFTSSENSKLSSLIKVSPLKSLLREDLKRRICAKANNRITRNAASAFENNNVIQSTSTPSNLSSNSTAICNGTITSSGQETESSVFNRKQILTCLFCGIEFPDETLYFLHKGCHCESNPWKCNICGEQCNNVYEFNSHLLSKSHQ